jgi:dUTP pyrophosphatase
MEVSEQAYVNGYESGYAAGRRSAGADIKSIKAVVDVGCKIPSRAHETDAGLDLYAAEDGWVWPKSRKTFGTGLHVAIPKGYVGFLTSKSGMMKKGMTSRGTIDSDYRGSIKAVIYNHGWLPYRIRRGQKITQLVILPIITPYLDIVDSLDETERGTGGFGSTGKY